jgi:hypothetical protein
MLGGLLLVGVTCAGSSRPSDERRRAIGRGTAFALAALPACAVVLGDLLFDPDDAVTVHAGAYAVVALAMLGVGICCVSACSAARDADGDDGAGKVVGAVCWGVLLGYLAIAGAIAMEEVSSFGVTGDERRDVYGHFGVTACAALFFAALPWAAWVMSRFGGDGAIYVRVADPIVTGTSIAAPTPPANHAALTPVLAHAAMPASAPPTNGWRAHDPQRRSGGPYMYATRDGVVVWEDGRCAVPVSELAQDMPVVVTGAIGPFHQVRLPAGIEGVVVKSELRW